MMNYKNWHEQEFLNLLELSDEELSQMEENYEKGFSLLKKEINRRKNTRKHLLGKYYDGHLPDISGDDEDRSGFDEWKF